MLLGLDIGTAGAHAVAIDESGSVAASASSGYATQSPRTGWTEQDPDDWWRATAQVLAAVARKVHGEIAGLGLTGQRGCVFVDAAGTPVRPAILGSDRRAASQAHYISEQIGARRLIEISGSPALPGQQAPAILWLRDVEPVQLRHTRRVLPAKDYVRLLLTGEAATDAADAAGTLLLDLRRRRWSDEILDALEIPIIFQDRAAGTSKMSAKIALEAIWLVPRLRRSAAAAIGRSRGALTKSQPHDTRI